MTAHAQPPTYGLPSYVGYTRLSFDPNTGAFNFTPDTVGRTRAALARQEVTSPAQGDPADIRIIGHSIVVGGGADSPRYKRSWVARLREMLTGRFGSAGTGIVPLNADSSDTGQTIVYSGTWTTDTARGIGNNARSGVSGASIYWPNVYCDKFRIYQAKRTDGGVVQTYIDQGSVYGSGSSPVNIGIAGSEAFLVNGPTASAGRGVHSLRVDLYSKFTGLAVEGYLNGGGVRVSRLGLTGSKLAAHLSTTNPTSSFYADSMPSADGVPDCIVFMCMVNDVFNSGGYDVPTYMSKLGSAIDTWKAADIDVILVAEPEPQTTGAQNPAPTADDFSLAKWQSYLTGLYAVAEAHSAALLDVNNLFGDWDTAHARGLMGDTLHPSNAGHYRIAQAFYEALVPGGSFKPNPNAQAAIPYKAINRNTNPSTAYTIPDVDVATRHKLTLNDDCTLTFPTAADGAEFDLLLKQDATGSRVVTWPETVLWPGGTEPTLTATAGQTDWFRFVYDGADWLGETVGQNL